MPEISRIEDRFYIVATSSVIDPQRLILKHNDTFGIFDRYGDILPLGEQDQGIYHGGTRYLSWLELRLNGKRPLFLSSMVDGEDILLTVDLTNPDIYQDGELFQRRDSMHIMRSRNIFANQCFEYLRLKSFSLETIQLQLELIVQADFRDIFEIRGLKRKQRGKVLPLEHREQEIIFRYDGLDGIRRTTRLRFSRQPVKVEENQFTFAVELKPGGLEALEYNFEFLEGEQQHPRYSFGESVEAAQQAGQAARRSTELHTSNELFNEAANRSMADIRMMLTETEHGPYPYGGIPWFCTPFGRDGLITALESLWFQPEIARGVLAYLAARQAKTHDEERVAQPGKIMHESRKGEMALLAEIPFGLYYGSVDATPLFIMLAGAYFRRTGDRDFVRTLWPNIMAALQWMEEYGDVDDDGFLEYLPDQHGLVNQGWKDSNDSIFHRDGQLPEGPIALCEVQGYQYAAKKEAANLAWLMGNERLSVKLLEEAEFLREKFDEAFWDEEMGTYVLALDGRKRPCRIMTSNAGHALFTGIAEPEKAERLATALTTEPMFSGWGIRTLAATEIHYNPISYHNGSVWPHDNAMIASGMARYGLKEQFSKVFSAMFDASLFMDYHRLPELFCGFHRRPGLAPTLYPVACSPQTWAAGALLLMLAAGMGLSFEAENRNVIFTSPFLPPFLDRVALRRLPVTRGETVDLRLHRFGADITMEVLRRPENARITVVK